jgi:putative oxidoreductase
MPKPARKAQRRAPPIMRRCRVKHENAPQYQVGNIKWAISVGLPRSGKLAEPGRGESPSEVLSTPPETRILIRVFEQTAKSRAIERIAGGTSTMDTGVDPKRLIFPGLAGIYQCFSPYSYAFMRFSTGAVLVPHGVQKVFYLTVDRYADLISSHGVPMARPLAYLMFFTELVAASCLALGLFTRVAAAMIWVEMLVIITVFQWEFGYFWTNRGYEYALLWLLLCTAIFFRGGGRYSLDHLIGKEF